MNNNFTFLVLEPIHPSGIEILKRHGKVIQLDTNTSSEDVLKFCREADAFISRGFVKIPKEVSEASKKLKVIGVHGVGIDHIDIKFAESKGVQIIRTPEELSESVAEFAIGLMLALLRKIPLADSAVRRGEWNKKYSDLVGAEFMGKTVGILGLGRIGSAVAKRLCCFNVNLISPTKQKHQA